MVNYTDMVDYLLTTARKHPNIRFVYFGTDVDVLNRNDFVCPGLIISPTISTLTANSVVQYGFQIIYLDKLNQQEDNFPDVLESSFQYLISYLSVVDLYYKVMKEGISIEPVILTEGGTMIGQQIQFYIEDQYNIDRFKSHFYGSN